MIVFYFRAIKIILLFFPCQRHRSLICMFREFLRSVLTQFCVPKWCLERDGHGAICQGQAVNFLSASWLTSLSQGWSTFLGAEFVLHGLTSRTDTTHLLGERMLSSLSHDPGAECRQVTTTSGEVSEGQSQHPKSLACAGQSSYVQVGG